MAPYNPLAMRLVRTKRDRLQASIDAGELTAEQGASELRAYKLKMLQRRGNRAAIVAPKP